MTTGLGNKKKRLAEVFYPLLVIQLTSTSSHLAGSAPLPTGCQFKASSIFNLEM